MTEISDRYRKRAAAFTAKVDAVPNDAWSQPSPCPDWTARDVVGHIVDSSLHFLQSVDVGADVPSVHENPKAAWYATRDAVQSAVDHPATAEIALDGPMGNNTLAERVDQYLSFDLVVHAWDLSRAAGIDDSLDPDTVQEARVEAEALAELGRQMGAFGPEVDIRDDASEQEKLLALVGRKAR